MNNGRYGEYGGQYISETLMNELIYLEKQYYHYMNDPEFVDELNTLLKEYAGRPSLLYYAKRMSEDLGGAKIYLKREDLNHTGAHKINNVLGELLLQVIPFYKHLMLDVEYLILPCILHIPCLKVQLRLQ